MSPPAQVCFPGVLSSHFEAFEAARLFMLSKIFMHLQIPLQLIPSNHLLFLRCDSVLAGLKDELLSYLAHASDMTAQMDTYPHPQAFPSSSFEFLQYANFSS